MDIERVKDYLSWISVADNTSEVNGILPRLCYALDLPKPLLCEEYGIYYMIWDLMEHDDEHDCSNVDCPVYFFDKLTGATNA
jgi:hypothetical protein